ncbi:MAG: ribonuclease HII [Candidatus Eisenbacteria bacterium]|uniref:Ribonuclease HII n=1 Tax=Eiseniibacteriota bacterium TaxID=2212470 RepID=A0A956NKZ4_UNCEI|nr:ribonuclease HII [Candidatus Eisenbacteria bacterium]
MKPPLSETSLADLRERFLVQGGPCSPQTLGRLRQDPRKGVQALAEQLARRSARARAENRRMDDLLAFERERWGKGIIRIAGTDEVGVGPLAGPVVAAAVILPPDVRVEGVNDSKQLRPEQREALSLEIRERAVTFAFGEASLEEIERINIRNAGFLAMRRALEALSPEPELVVIDAHRLDGLPWPQEPVIKADASIHCVACASVLAKVHRDAYMVEMDRLYPGYGFAEHKGYGCPSHLDALKRLGPSPIHRAGFHWAGRQLSLFGD